MNNFNGMPVILDPLVMADSNVRTFKVSRHRSKRMHKKLMKRFGSEWVKEPACFQTASGKLIIHPLLWQQLKEQIKDEAQPELHRRSQYIFNALSVGVV